MKIYNVEEKPLPIGRRIWVYAFDIKSPRWTIDKFIQEGKNDHYQLNGKYYPHNISHWAELPGKPKSE